MDLPQTVGRVPASPATEESGFDRNADETIDVNAAAKLLHCDFEQVEFLARRGEIPATKIGRGWIFLRTQLINSIAERASNEARLRRASRPQDQLAPDGVAASKLAPCHRPRGRPRKHAPPLPSLNQLREISATRASEPDPIHAD
jgi:hypothetical protein